MQNELRIGNWVDCRKGITQVVGVQVDCIETMALSDTLEYFDPIPLTPEILEECGFVKTTIDRVVFWELEVGRTGKFQFYKGVMQFGVFGVANYEYHDVRPQYLHQLQNLYFSLTNTELTWNRKQ